MTFSYPETTRKALDDVNLDLPNGKLTLICGPSGGGKSTLLRCLPGFVPRFSKGEFDGEVLLHGESITGREPRELASSIGMVFQNPEDQVVGATVEADVAFGPENLGIPLAELRQRVTQSLSLAGIERLRLEPTRNLSAGQLQKTAVAGMLAFGPDILVLDEPTSQIDPVSARELLELLNDLVRHAGKTVVLCEHRLETAAAIADYMAVVAAGKLVAFGPPREILASSNAHEWGLSRPPVLSLALALRERGQWSAPLPLSVSEFRHSATSRHWPHC
ncbi:MAG: ABC transporter ATP-binding protein [Chloroflexi bacterium]|nr:ABC transporter ATP-binding protein [Chloroflexota bacterium]